MRNLRKLTAVVIAIALVLTSMTAAFAATGATPVNGDKAIVLNELGLYAGVSSTTFDPDLESNLTREQGTILLLKLFGLDAKAAALTDAEVATALTGKTDAAKVSDWAKKAVAYAVANKIMSGKSDATVNPSDKITGAEFATLIVKTMGYDVADWTKAVTQLSEIKGSEVADEFATVNLTRDAAVAYMFGALTAEKKDAVTIIAALIAADPTKKDVAVEAGLVAGIPTFQVAIATTKSLTVTFDQTVDTAKATFSVKKGSIVIPVTTTWNDKKTVATLTYGVDFAAGDYAVTVGGLGIAAGSDAKTVTVTPERIDTIQVDANAYRDAVTTTTVAVTYKLLNQYGEDITKKYATTNFTVSSTKGSPSVSAQGTITVTSVADDVASFGVTVVDKTFAKTATATVTTLAAKNLSEITLGTPVVKTDKTKLEAGVNDYDLPYTAKDQYGNSYTLTAADLSKITFVSSDSDVIAVTDANVFEVKNIDTDTDNELTVDFKSFNGPKDVTLTAIVNATGKSSKVTFTVYGSSVADAPSLVAPTTRFGSNDTAYKVQLTVLDQYGVAMSASDIDSAVATGKFTITSGNTSIFTVAGDPVVVDSDKAYVVLTGATTGTANLTVTVNASGKSATLPITVVAAKYAAAITLVPDYTYAVSGASIVVKATVKDQYGDAMDTSSSLVALSVDNANFGAVADSTVTAMVSTGATLTATAYGKTTKLTAKLYNATSVDATKLVDTKELTLTSVASDAALTYEVESLGTIAAAANSSLASKYAKEIKVYAKDASGNKVSLVSPIKGVIAATDKAVVGTDSGVYKVAAVADKEGTATLSVVVETNKGVSTLTANVTVSKEAPAIKTITAKAGDDEVTALTIAKGTTVADLLTKNANLWFTVEDQYGTDALKSLSNIAIFVTTPAGTVTKITTDPAAVTFSGTKDQKYTVTAVTNNGLSKVIVVTLKD